MPRMVSGIFPARQKPCGGSGVLSQFAPALRTAVVERAGFLRIWNGRRYPVRSVTHRPRSHTGMRLSFLARFSHGGDLGYPTP
jgi:hypothetical protein